jgi:B12-binding domain/radical SAM domain protein
VKSADLVLVHPPSVFDFRERPVAAGPISDMVPSTSIFEMYPLGFLTLCNTMSRNGYSARICNLALRMLASSRFDPARYLRRLRARAFGVDIHWLVHAQGGLEVARLLKRLHPDVPVIVGGLSATYYHEELIRLPFVDYVVRGDSTEKPVVKLFDALKQGREPVDVPNLTWKRNGDFHVNELSWVPKDLDDVPIDFGEVITDAVKYMDPFSPLPYLTWAREGTTALLPFRGCVHDCVICGGSCSTYRRFFGRTRLGVRSPGALARDVAGIARLLRGPIVILGDLRMPGGHYAEKFFDAAAKLRISNQVVLEIHGPVAKDFLERAVRVFPRLNLIFSPESIDERVRKRFGRKWGNREFFEFMDYAPRYCKRIDLFFMIGLPEQTRESVARTADFCEDLMRPLGKDCNIQPQIAPLGPFIDPGSPIFESPEEYGYTLRYRTLADHAKAQDASTFKELLAFDTRWLSREDIVELGYTGALSFARKKAKYGLISKRMLDAVERNVKDATAGNGDGAPSLSGTTVLKSELAWPGAALHVRPLEALRYAAQGLFKS